MKSSTIVTDDEMDGASAADDEMDGATATDDEMDGVTAPLKQTVGQKILELEKKYGVPREALHAYATNKGASEGTFGDRMIGSAVGGLDEFFAGAPNKAARVMLGMIKGPKWEDSLDELDAFVNENKPTGQKVLEFVTGLAGAAKLKKPLQAVGQGMAYGYSHASKKDEVDSAALGGGIAAGAPVAFKAAGKVIQLTYQQAQKLIPGASGAADWTNHTAAWLAANFPFTHGGTTKDEIYDLMSNPKLRREAAVFDPKGGAREIKEGLKHAQRDLGAGVKDEFSAHRASAENSLTLGDLKNFNPAEIIEEAMRAVSKNKGFYSRKIRRILGNALKISKGRGPGQSRLPTETTDKLKRELLAIDHNLGGANRTGIPDEAMSQYDDILDLPVPAAGHLHAANKARQYLDNHIKWGNSSGRMSPGDQEILKNTRDAINAMLKDNLGKSSEYQRFSDDLWREYKTLADPLFRHLSTKNPATGKMEIDSAKILLKTLSNGDTRRIVFDEKIQDLLDFVAKYPQFKELPGFKSGMDAINRVLRISDLKKSASRLVLSGGPTSQPVNMVAQMFAAYGSNGITLLAAPITNPGGWLKLVDGLSKAGKHVQAEQYRQFGEAVKLMARQGTLTKFIADQKQKAEGGEP